MVKEKIMNTGTQIDIPENLFKAIDRVHKEATDIYKKIPGEALDLISPQRGKTNTNSTTNKNMKLK